MEYEYIKDAFTKAEDKTNLEVNNLNVDCITSKNQKFELDQNGNLKVKSIVAEDGLPNFPTILDVYPIGSVYISVVNTNPSSLFGGTWEAFASGRTLVGVDLEDMDFNESNKVGGEKAHILTIAEMPSHNHTQQYNGFNSSKVWGVAPQQGDGTQMSGQTTLSTGGNLAHNNMPPYFTVYMWKRIA